MKWIPCGFPSNEANLVTYLDIAMSILCNVSSVIAKYEALMRTILLLVVLNYFFRDSIVCVGMRPHTQNHHLASVGMAVKLLLLPTWHSEFRDSIIGQGMCAHPMSHFIKD